MDKNQINEVKNKVTDATSGILSGVVKTVKDQPRGFILGLGAGVLLTGPFPGGVVIAVIGIGIIIGSLFVKTS